MFRSSGILKSCVSFSSCPLKRFVVVPVGSAWHVLQVKTLPSRFVLRKRFRPVFGLPVAVAPPPD
jgi:hypothetical protein